MVQKYGMLVSYPEVVNYCNRRYSKVFLHARYMYIKDPHTTCSALGLNCNNITIVSPNPLWNKSFTDICFNIKDTIKQLTVLFNESDGASIDWYKNRLGGKLNRITYLFLILHRPTIDYKTTNPRINMHELVTNRAEMNMLELLDHVHAISNSGISSTFDCVYANELRFEWGACAHCIESMSMVTYTPDKREEYVDVYISPQNRSSDIANSLKLPFNQPVSDWCVHDSIQLPQKWDLTQLAEYTEIDINTLTIDGIPLDESIHPWLCDNSILSPLLRTVEYRTKTIARSLENPNHTTVTKLALNVGIALYSSNKKRTKKQLLELINRIPLY